MNSIRTSSAELAAAYRERCATMDQWLVDHPAELDTIDEPPITQDQLTDLRVSMRRLFGPRAVDALSAEHEQATLDHERYLRLSALYFRCTGGAPQSPPCQRVVEVGVSPRIDRPASAVLASAVITVCVCGAYGLAASAKDAGAFWAGVGASVLFVVAAVTIVAWAYLTSGDDDDGDLDCFVSPPPPS